MKIKIPFFQHFGTLPYSWSSLGIIVLAGFAESIGISLFIPLLEIMQNGTAEADNAIMRAIQGVYDFIGLELTLYTSLGGIVILVTASLLIGFVQRVLIAHVQHLFIQRLRSRLAQSLFAANWEYLSGIRHGGLINLIMQETNRGGYALLAELNCIAGILQILILLGFAAVISWELVALCVVFAIVTIALISKLLLAAKVLGKEKTVIHEEISFSALDFLRGAKFIKLTASETSVGARFDDILSKAYRNYLRSDINKSAVYFFSQALPLVMLAFTISTAYGWFGIPTPMILVFLLILMRIAPRLSQLQQQYQTYMLAAPALESVHEQIAANERNAEEHARAGETFTGLQDGVSVENIRYSYSGTDAVAIDGITLDIRRNRFCAIVGPSGSGKSTLVDLITGIRKPDAGRIAVDGIDLNTYDTDSWRCHIGYVGQETTIFNDTVRNNLCFAHPDATDDEIMARLKIANFHSVLDGFDNGLDTMLGENGTRLSGGERQRLAIARALMGNPALLILDEATSALDNESEHLVQSAIEKIAGETTTIVIAHRLSTVRMADIIFVMENGRIVETGTFNELIDAGQRFAELYNIQFAQ
ncbi:MAG: ABC transporter ATP-binding protein [Rhodospirillales bacterium]